jgi:hypothetical protein
MRDSSITISVKIHLKASSKNLNGCRGKKNIGNDKEAAKVIKMKFFYGRLK